jgi:hypothetical protein
MHAHLSMFVSKIREKRKEERTYARAKAWRKWASCAM